MAIIDEPQVESTAQVGAGEALPRRRRRWPWVVAAVLVAAFVAFNAWAYTYQPLGLRSGGSNEWPGQSVPAVGQPMSQYAYDALQWETPFLIYTNQRDTRFGFAYTISNDGPFGVTLLGIDKNSIALPSGLMNGSVYRLESGSAVVKNAGFPDVVSTKFHWGSAPVALAPDTYDTAVGATWTYVGCPSGMITGYSPGLSWISAFEVRYRFLWFTKTATIPLNHKMGLVNPSNCSSANN